MRASGITVLIVMQVIQIKNVRAGMLKSNLGGYMRPAFKKKKYRHPSKKRKMKKRIVGIRRTKNELLFC